MEGWKGDMRVDISLSHTARSTLRYFSARGAINITASVDPVNYEHPLTAQ